MIYEKTNKGLNIKVLADIFESILGAVFVDSSGNHKIVSYLINKFLGKHIGQCVELI